jgi:DNA-binding LacI/PurR family transcriptional regulator
MNENITPLLKYEQIMHDLLNQIQSGDFSYDVPICTEKQLCETYQTSRITAKRALKELEHKGLLYRKRGVGSFVARNAFANISATAPAPAADSVAKNVALLLPFLNSSDLSRSSWLAMIESLNQFLDEEGHFLSIHISSRNPAKERNNLESLLSQNVCGLIYYPESNHIHLDLLNAFVFQEKPVVVMDKDINCPYLHNITSDNFRGGWLLAEHLVSRGHQNIAFITTDPLEDTTTLQNRFGGYLRYMQSMGIRPKQEHLLELPFYISEEDIGTSKYDTFKANIETLYNSGVTALLCDHDQTAYFTYRACLDIGLSVPEDISICGYDNSHWSTQPEIGITTIDQTASLIGKKISEILLESFTTPATNIRRHVIPVTLVERGSTGVRKRGKIYDS